MPREMDNEELTRLSSSVKSQHKQTHFLGPKDLIQDLGYASAHLDFSLV
jgi:hypothetical protein